MVSVRRATCPLRLWQNTPHLRDKFLGLDSVEGAGRHELKLGGELLNLHTDVIWSTFKFGQIDAMIGRPTADALQAIFPGVEQPGHLEPQRAVAQHLELSPGIRFVLFEEEIEPTWAPGFRTNWRL